MSRSFASRLSLALYSERVVTERAMASFHAGTITVQKAVDLITEARDIVDALIAEVDR